MTGNAVRVARTVIGILAAGGAGGVASADASHTVRIASHISIHSHGLRFGGKVTSSNHACVLQRRVTLYRTNGDVLGHTHTNSHGHWSITASGSAGISMGHFYAKARRESQGAAGTIYVCRAARSSTIPFGSGAPNSYG